MTGVISMDWSSRILNTFDNMEISGRNTNVHGFSSVLYLTTVKGLLGHLNVMYI